MSTKPTSIPVFRTVASFREWKRGTLKSLREDGERSMGLIPTMGALHEGHLSLIRESLRNNDLTVMSLFVNPAQFAPHEDLSTYPRTFDSDMAKLEETIVDQKRVDAVFFPTVEEMYPSGIVQDRGSQKGTFIEVLGYSHQMEGTTRPGFFRGVATVVLKLFNAVEPTDAYFGQKDIQQALILRRMLKDLLLTHPSSQRLHIIPTARDATSGLALSSRNVYLTDKQRNHAPALYGSLCAGRDLWNSSPKTVELRDKVLLAAREYIYERIENAKEDGVEIKIDYVELCDANEFEAHVSPPRDTEAKMYVLSGAMWVGKTRLIDNILLYNPTSGTAS